MSFGEAKLDESSLDKEDNKEEVAESKEANEPGKSNGVRKVEVGEIEEVSINNKTLIVYVRPPLTSIRTTPSQSSAT